MSTPKQRHAVRERCSSLRRALEAFETAFLEEGGTQAERAERHEVLNLAAEQILAQANHLRKALQFAAPGFIERDLADRIRHVRNIYEHWEQNRSAFLDSGSKVEGSARWFADRYPNRSPLTYEWSKVGGFKIAGIIDLAELHDLIEAALEEINTPPPSDLEAARA